MTRTPLALAALATAAVPELNVVDVLHPRAADFDVDEAIVVDDRGERWTVRAPQRPAVGTALEVEATVLTHVRNLPTELPFAVPVLAGSAPLEEGGRVFVHQFIPGNPLVVEDLRSGPGLAAEVGRCIAAIHEMPAPIADASGLPSYEAEEYRKRRLAELDEAARSGKVPVHLLDRWERQLENVALWRFTPVLTHADLAPDVIITDGDRVNGILAWGAIQVADPADDLAWVVAAVEPSVADTILEAYWLARTELRDPHLPERAALASELALIRWLLHGLATESDEVVTDATVMLERLSEQILAEEAAAEAAEEEQRQAELAAEEARRQAAAEAEAEEQARREAETAAAEEARQQSEAAVATAAAARVTSPEAPTEIVPLVGEPDSEPSTTPPGDSTDDAPTDDAPSDPHSEWARPVADEESAN